MIVGILGGIGSGKTTVTRMMVELGAEAVDADRLAHDALESAPIRKALVEWLGEEVLCPDGKVNRKQVAKRVFSSPRELEKIEKLVHPEVVRRIEEKAKEHRRLKREDDLLVLDVPLLLSSPLRRLCQAMVFVDVKEEVRRERVQAKGWEPGELERRERLQTSLEEKRRLADLVIDNSGALEETRPQVEACYARLKSRTVGLSVSSGEPSAQGFELQEDGANHGLIR